MPTFHGFVAESSVIPGIFIACNPEAPSATIPTEATIFFIVNLLFLPHPEKQCQQSLNWLTLYPQRHAVSKKIFSALCLNQLTRCELFDRTEPTPCQLQKGSNFRLSARPSVQCFPGRPPINSWL